MLALVAASLLQELEQEAHTTRRLLERVPDNRLSWRPHEKGRTLGELAMHVAMVPGSVAELAGYFASLTDPSPYLRPLVDIGNSWSIGEPPGNDDIATLAPIVDLIHLKDRDFDARRTVPLGDGKVPWAEELKRLLGGVTVPEVVASMETHCPQDGRNATAKSVAALRRIAAEIGVEVV